MPDHKSSVPSLTSTPAIAAFNATEALRVAAESKKADENARAMFSIPNEMFMRPSVTICSIWPENLESLPFAQAGMGRFVYRIDAGSPSKPAYLTVENTYDLIIQQAGPERYEHQAASISGAHRALNLVQYWVGDHPGNAAGRKGVMIISGTEATPHEIRVMMEQQNGFLRFLVDRADDYHRIGKSFKISGEHRKALEMLHLDVKMHPWYTSVIQLYNDCPQCSNKIYNTALKCQYCNESLAAYFVDREIEINAAEWPNLPKEMEFLKKKMARAKVG